ncbi:MAG: pyruvate kinase [Acidobacteriota bacterium]|nr:pyruvate kinase [Acidobacteriota bacterium]
MMSTRSRPRTKIVCTLGPSVRSRTSIKQLVEAGMNVARLNMAHGTMEDHTTAFSHVRSIAEELKRPVGIMVDVPGPKYRTGDVPSGSISFKEGRRVTLTSRQDGADGEDFVVPVKPAGIHRDARPGNRVLLNDGMITLEIREVQGEDVHCEALTAGRITPGRGVTTPGVEPSQPFPDEKATAAMGFAARQQADFVALSTVTTSDDVAKAREILLAMGFGGGIYSKVERSRAVTNQASIINESDGIIVARGDLGTEIRLARVPVVQKELIALCNELGKPVITATQMLESMISLPVPTRAEVTDVANAVFDGTDAVMLSGETSIGRYPLEAVRVMAEVSMEAEKALPYDAMLVDKRDHLEPLTDDAISYNACQTAHQLGASLIVAFTESGGTAKRVSKYRPRTPVLALVHNERTRRSLTVTWGVQPVTTRSLEQTDDFFDRAREEAVRRVGLKKGALVVLVAGVPIGHPGGTDLLRVLTI